jgi:hypothetical protein
MAKTATKRVDIYNLAAGVVGFGSGVKIPNKGSRCLKNFPADRLDEGAWRLTEGDRPFIAVVNAGSKPPAAFRKAMARLEGKPEVENVEPTPEPEAKEAKKVDWESPERQATVEPEPIAKGQTLSDMMADDAPEIEKVATVAEAPVEESQEESQEATASDVVAEEKGQEEAPEEVAETSPPMGSLASDEEAEEVQSDPEPAAEEESADGDKEEAGLPDESWGSIQIIEFVKAHGIKVKGSRTKANMLASISEHYGAEEAE